MPTPTPAPQQGKVARAVGLPIKVINHARRKGLKRSAKLGAGILNTQSKALLPGKQQRKFVFISSAIDNTGAPTVLLQIIDEFVAKHGASHVVLITPSINADQARRVHELGISVGQAANGLQPRLIGLQLALRRDDFVLMNTAAIHNNYRDFILRCLRGGRLNHAYWFIHEAPAQLSVVDKQLLDNKRLDQTRRLLEDAKLTLLTPSAQTTREYVDLLKCANVRAVNLHVEIDDRYKRVRPASDYASIRFLLSGTPFDGRKGQLLALSALYCFLKTYYEKAAPGAYRPFQLHLVAIGDDYVSQQVTWIARSLLKDHVVIHPQVTREAALEITSKCNTVICCSLDETFALYVAEGMFMGHVVLRNNSAGVDEQLRDGENGYFIVHTDIEHFAGVIERVLNIETSDADLQAMGQTSQAMISEYSSYTYRGQIETL